MIETEKIYCIDALEGLKQLNDNSVDLIVTDPPYNLGKDFANDDLSEEEFINFLTPIMIEMGRVIKPKHSIIIFFDNGKSLPLFWKCLFKSKLYFQKGCSFIKPNDQSFPHNRIARKSEVFYVLSKTPELHHDGETYIADYIIGNWGTMETWWHHPTAKNLDVIRELVLSHSVKGELVVDPFVGSGSCPVACKQTGRKYIGFDISEEYCKIGIKRLEQAPLLGLNVWGN